MSSYVLVVLEYFLTLFSGLLQIDAVAKSRDGKFRVVSNDEREQTLNQLLTVRSLLTSAAVSGICHFVVWLMPLCLYRRWMDLTAVQLLLFLQQLIVLMS